MASPKQQAFVREFLKDHNAKRSAIRAGCSEKFADQKGYKLKKDLAAAIAAGEAEQAQRAKIEADDVLERLQQIVAVGMQELPLIVNGEQVLTTSGDPVFKLADAKSALRALELIGKALGLFRDRLEVTEGPSFEALEEARQRVINMGAMTPGVKW